MDSIPPTLFLLLLFLFPISSVHSNPIRLPSASNDVVPTDPCSENPYNNYRYYSYYSSGSCPVTCFRADPVCGEDGVTYWCGCQEARCAGAKVARKGFCEVGNSGTGGQALLLVHIVWLFVIGFSVLFGLF